MTSHQQAATPNPTRFARQVALKALLLFVLLNLALVAFDPLPLLGRASAYNWLWPGRARLPYAEVPERAYSLSLFQLEAMFASHELARPRPVGEFRVLLVGDSSVWGFLLENDDTLAANINAGRYQLPDGRRVRAYNIGYPILSLTKDLLLLSYARHYQPDLIVWLVTLESFPDEKQLFPPLVQHNPDATRGLIAGHNLRLDPADPRFVDDGLWQRTLWGRRRALADLLRLQLYGALWAATGIDQDIPDTYTPRQEDLDPDHNFHDQQPPALQAERLAFDVLAAGLAEAGGVPVLIVNEPMFVSRGQNSHIRYNYFYPRWAYDDYRRLLADMAAARGWKYLDLWDAVPETEFTDSPIHLTPTGSALLAARLGAAILDEHATWTSARQSTISLPTTR
jgi:hypothetical protein